jgi:hypothetical protein
MEAEYDLDDRWRRFVDSLGVVGAAGARLRYLALEVGLAVARGNFYASDQLVVGPPGRLGVLPLWRRPPPN